MLHEVLFILNGISDCSVPILDFSIHVGEKELLERCHSLGSIYRKLRSFYHERGTPKSSCSLYERCVLRVLDTRLKAYEEGLISLERTLLKERIGTVRLWMENLDPWRQEFQFWSEYYAPVLESSNSSIKGIQWWKRLYQVIPGMSRVSTLNGNLYRVAENLESDFVALFLTRQFAGLLMAISLPNNYEYLSIVLDPFGEFPVRVGKDSVDLEIDEAVLENMPESLRSIVFDDECLDELVYILVARGKHHSISEANSQQLDALDNIRDDFLTQLKQSVNSDYQKMKLKSWCITSLQPLVEQSLIRPSVQFWHSFYASDVRSFVLSFLRDLIFYGDTRLSQDLFYPNGDRSLLIELEVTDVVLEDFPFLQSFKIGGDQTVVFDWELSEPFEWILFKKQGTLIKSHIQEISKLLYRVRLATLRVHHLQMKLRKDAQSDKERQNSEFELMILSTFISSLADYFFLVVDREIRKLLKLALADEEKTSKPSSVESEVNDDEADSHDDSNDEIDEVDQMEPLLSSQKSLPKLIGECLESIRFSTFLSVDPILNQGLNPLLEGILSAQYDAFNFNPLKQNMAFIFRTVSKMSQIKDADGQGSGFDAWLLKADFNRYFSLNSDIS